MTNEMASPRKVVRANGIKRRTEILEATLRVVLRSGVRGVRHRAVAAEAQVPLASTTYYFRDIEELLCEAFLFWSNRKYASAGRFKERVQDYLLVFSSVITSSN